MQRALITGSNGFIGRALCARLEAQGVTVDWFDKKNGLDVTNKEHVDRRVSMFKPDVIFHLAAVTTTQEAADNPAECYATNVGGTAVVLGVAESRDVPRVIVPCTYLPPTEHYSMSKQLAEQFCQLHRYRNSVVFKHCNVYGPGDPNETRIVPALMQKALAGEIPVISAHFIRYFVYIDDIIDCYVELGARPASPRNVAMIGVPVELTELARKIQTIAGRNPLVRLVDKGSDSLGAAPLKDYRRIESKVELDEGLKKTMDWYKSQLTTKEQQP